jgi:integrase
MKVGEYLENWLAGKHSLKPKTVSLYRDALDLYLIPHLGHIGLLELRAHHLDRFYAAITIGKRGKPLSPSSIRRIHAALRSALNTAVKRRLIPYNPALHVELAPENPHRPKPWTADQCQTFLGKIREDRLSTLYHVMIVTGLCRGEAIGLRWEDVDLAGEPLLVRHPTDHRGAGQARCWNPEDKARSTCGAHRRLNCRSSTRSAPRPRHGESRLGRR